MIQNLTCVLAILCGLCCHSLRPFQASRLRDISVASFQFSSILDALKISTSSSSPSSQKAISDLKSDIKMLAAGTQNGMKASEEVKVELASKIGALEKLNKVNNIATAGTLLDGSWDLCYTTNGGSSAGKLGPFVGSVEQSITYSQGDYINYVKLFNGAVLGALVADWDVLGNKKWQVNFQSIEFKIAGITLIRKELKARGIWRYTYLDEDMRILYAQGKAEETVEKKKEVVENVYVLIK